MPLIVSNQPTFSKAGVHGLVVELFPIKMAKMFIFTKVIFFALHQIGTIYYVWTDLPFDRSGVPPPSRGAQLPQIQGRRAGAPRDYPVGRTELR